MKRSLNLAIPEDVARQLDWLAECDFRRSRDEAARLLVDAVRRAASALPTATADSVGPRPGDSSPSPIVLADAAPADLLDHPG